MCNRPHRLLRARGQRQLSRQYLDPVAARVSEVDRPTAVAVGDLIGLGLLWVGPVRDPPFAEPREEGVELAIAYREGVMLRRELVSGVGEIERRAGREPNRVKPAAGANRGRRRQSEHLREKGSGSALVARMDDQMVEIYRHEIRVAGPAPLIGRHGEDAVCRLLDTGKTC
jgi:hypothetical protein